MITKILIIITTLSLLPLSGCGMVELAQLPHEKVENWRTFDPNDYDIEIIRKDDGSTSYNWTRNTDFNEKDNVLPYWKHSGALFKNNVIEGQLNGKAYPVIFDTGCNPMIVISERLVTESDLPVFFFKPDNKQSSFALVIADSLKIGSLELTDYPCGLWSHKAEFRIFGLPIHKPELILIPLNMMRQFNYFKFDNLNKEVAFSKASSFAAADKSEWLSLPFRIEGLYLLLDVSIEGMETTLRLDTGAQYQLKLDESIVQELFKKRPDFAKAWKKNTYLYRPYAGGKITGKKFTAKSIHFSNQKLDRVELIYADINQDKGYQGIIGYELFEKTVMVLDFKKNLMWVKKAKGSRFEQ
ncbi:MAG: hypothetical protein FVQ79_12440 [Planctomycetes bacterium]|nr:hypothetical protein [Planctomycetota bacterium]